MKIITRATLDWKTGKVLHEESYEYKGPVARAMTDARSLGDLVCAALLPAAADATGQTTASASWFDVSNWIGDLAIIVNVGSITGSFGSVKVQLQSATANTGAGAANETADSRNSGLLTVAALGAFVMPYAVDELANKFVGVVCTYTTLTAAVMSVELVGRKEAV